MKLPFINEKKENYSDPSSATSRKVNRLANNEDNIQGLSDLYIPEEAEDFNTSPQQTTADTELHDLPGILADMGKLSTHQRTQLRREIDESPHSSAADIILKKDIVEPEDVFEAKARLHGLEFRHITAESVEKEAFQKLAPDFVRNAHVIALAIEGNTLVVGTSSPENVFELEDVKNQTDMELKIVVCSSDEIEAVCAELGEEESLDYSVDDIISDMGDVEVVQDQQKDFEDLERMAGQSPVIKFVNYLISNAIHEGASDIHIEPKPKQTRIRYRIDGVLFQTMESPANMHPAIVSRIKIMSNLDISERRLPQDGKISVIVGGRKIDLRVSTLPTNRGEKVVIRILDSRSIIRGLEQLGMEDDITAAFEEQINLPHGILLVTGPTGSGKSTTLYSALSQMDGNTLNVSTVEDPVEYELDFCNQVQAWEKIGLTFSSALRSLLRQDPDVIMIGEIRDAETAKIAVQAALTGHLVLSTLHTNDAASSVTRLVNIGIEAYLIAASLNAVLAQRLVRKICPACKEPYKAPKNVSKYLKSSGLKPEELYKGAGCDKCRHSGYVGRIGIYELLIIDDNFRNIISSDPSVANMRRAFHESNQRSLFEDGIMKVKQQHTTIDEVLRVTEVYGAAADDDME